MIAKIALVVGCIGFIASFYGAIDAIRDNDRSAAAWATCSMAFAAFSMIWIMNAM